MHGKTVKFISGINVYYGAWGTVVVKALRYKWGGPGIDPLWGFFPWFPPTEPRALGSTQPPENEYQGFLLG